MIDAVGFDGDDTLWECETAFHLTQSRVREVLARHCDPDVLDARLLDVERANLELYGYGAKAFTLSLVETAIDLAGDAVTAADVRTLLDLGKELLAHPVELRPHAAEAVEAARARGLRTVIVTKGDLFHQESKVARSGLADLVDGVAIVAEKDGPTYARVLAQHGIDPAGFVMVGNSLRSDAAPVLDLGGWAAHVPHPLTWALEAPDDESVVRAHGRFRELDSLAQLAPELDRLTN